MPSRRPRAIPLENSPLPLSEAAEERLVGVAEVAEMSGVTKAAVTNWRSRGTAGFPNPAVETKASPLFRRSEIESWLATRRIKHRSHSPAEETHQPLGIEGTLWALSDKLRGSVDASQYRHVLQGLLFLRFATGPASGPTPFHTSSTWDDFAEVRPEMLAATLDRALADLENKNPSLANALPRYVGASTVDPRRLKGLVDVVGQIRPESGDGRDLLGRIYEYFLGRFASLEGRSGGEFYTPSSVVSLLVEILEPLEGVVYDPCCGSGGMFVQSKRFLEAHGGDTDRLSVFGQELNEGTWRLAKMNLALHGLRADLGERPADTFHDDQHPDIHADFVLANPPFNMSDWGVVDLSSDKRWAHGTPPAGNANLAWVQHIVARLNTNGRAGIVLANGSLASEGTAESAIRRSLVEADLIECMVALPGQIFYSTGIPATLWFVARDKRSNGDRRGQTLFIDASKCGDKVTRTHKVLSAAEINEIVATYHGWTSGLRVDGAKIPSAVATVADIARNGYALAPSRYVHYVSDDNNAQSANVEDLTRQYFALNNDLRRLDEAIAVALHEVVPT